MIRKVLMGTAVAGLLGGLIFGSDLFSYMRTSASNVREAVKAEVPLEFEIDRAREMVENLVPDIRRCMHMIAEQQVDIERMRENIDEKVVSLDTQKKAILALRTDLSSGDEEYVYAGRRYTSDEVRRDLSTRFERFKTAEAGLKRDSQILAAREKALEANEQKLEKMLDAKQELVVQLEQLEARLKTLQATETAASVEFDDTQLSRAQSLINDLNRQIDVREKVMAADGKLDGEIPVETEAVAPSELTREIDAYFGDDAADEPETGTINVGPDA